MSMMMTPIYNILNDLKAHPYSEGDAFHVTALPEIPDHKIGISRTGEPMFFIHCTGTGKPLDINLELISVLFNRKCQLNNNGVISSGDFTIVSLRTHNPDLQRYFIDIVYLVISELPKDPSVSLVKTELNKLIHLFSSLSKPPRQTIQGLWAELFLIDQSPAPEYMVNSWHISPNDKFDFNDGTDKIEVKGTAKSRRVHSFSMEQLHPNQSSNLLIASMFVPETGIGKSVFDLIDSISTRLIQNETRYKLTEIITQTLGSDLEKAMDIYFDYNVAKDSLKFYDFKVIPSIALDNVASEIQNVRFDSDISDVDPIDDNYLSQSQSKLFKNAIVL